jgi:GntR family transcriptional repressor for pyruvate dehydrogenase complex
MTKTRDAIADLKVLLLSGEVKAGERLPPEAELAARLGISRNVLREAVRALVHTGVLRTRQGDGTYVGTLDLSGLLDGVALYTQFATGARLAQVLEARRIIEPELTALAASSITERQLVELESLLQRMTDATSESDRVDSDVAFHHLIAEASGNELLAGLLDAMADLTVRPRVWRAVVDAGGLSVQLHQHRSIVDAIRAGDSRAAYAAALVHVADVARFFAAQADIDDLR